MCSVSTFDAKDGPVRTMSRVAGQTQRTGSAAGIYLANNPFSNQAGLFRTLYDPDKLVANNTLETCVPACYLQVGVADPRQDDPHERFAASI
jgi:hypothetical protein